MLHLLADAQSADIATLAADHPFTALALVLLSGAFGFAPSLLAKVKQKVSPAPAATATSQVDVNGQLLAQLVAGLERRAEEADRRSEASEAKHDALERRHYKETNELREQLREARSKIAALEAEIETMRQRLIRGQSG